MHEMITRDSDTINNIPGNSATFSLWWVRKIQEYKSVLQQCRKSQPFDGTLFIRFSVAGFAHGLKDISNFIKAKINRLVYQTMIVRAFSKQSL